MYILTPRAGRRNLTAIAGALDRSGITHRTLIPGPRRTIVLVVDLNDELGARVSAAARLLGGRYRALSGTGAFIGDGESRERARELYRAVVGGYESSSRRVGGACGVQTQGTSVNVKRPGSTAGLAKPEPAARWSRGRGRGAAFQHRGIGLSARAGARP